MRLHGLGVASGGDALATIADTIQQVEGYYPGTLAYRNNNPGNLVYTSYYAGAYGATPGAGGYAAFPDYGTGYAALQHQIQVDASSGLTITGMMYKWLGNGTGGDYQGYASTVAGALGVDPGTKVADVLAASVPTMAGTTDPDTAMFPSLADAVDWSPVAIAAGAVVALWALNR